MDLILKYCFKRSSTFETGLIDHQHLVYSMLKNVLKENSKIFIDQDYKNFHDTHFHMDLENKVEEFPKYNEIFEETFINILDAHAPRKAKVLFYVVIKNHILI